LAEIEGEQLLDLCSELESLEQSKPQSGWDLEGVGNSMDFGGEL